MWPICTGNDATNKNGLVLCLSNWMEARTSNRAAEGSDCARVKHMWCCISFSSLICLNDTQIVILPFYADMIFDHLQFGAMFNKMFLAQDCLIFFLFHKILFILDQRTINITSLLLKIGSKWKALGTMLNIWWSIRHGLLVAGLLAQMWNGACFYLFFVP